MTRTFSGNEIAAEAGIGQERLAWLVSVGIVRPQEPDVFCFGDVFRAKLLSALLDAGIPESVLERAVAEGWLNLDHIDGYLPLEPGPRSSRTFADFEASLGPEGSPPARRVRGLGVAPPRPGFTGPHRRGGALRTIPRGMAPLARRRHSAPRSAAVRRGHAVRNDRMGGALRREDRASCAAAGPKG